MKNSTTAIAFISAFSLHLIIGAVLLMGLEFSLPKDKPKEQVVVIKASLVNQKLFDDLVQKKAHKKSAKIAAEKREIEKKRKEKARIKREMQLAEKKRKEVENKRVKVEKADLARQKKEEDRLLFDKIVAAKALRAKKEAEKTQKIADEKHKQQEAERIKKQQVEDERLEVEKLATAKALKEKRAKEAEIKAAKIKAAKIKAAKAAKQKADRLRLAELDRQMEAEFENSFSSAQSSKQQSEINRYKALIQDKISRNWQLEPSMKGKTCTLAIRLAPDGLVMSAKYSKGDQKLCDSAKRATFKSKTLPIPKDPEIAHQFRDFDITLEPDL